MRKEIVRLRATLAATPDRELVARSVGMRRALDLARRAAASRATVLLTGESGVGKSVLARFIHAHSGREGKPFVQLNCAALPAGLVEAELFGVKRGAYTDAHADREGLLGEADGGTLFLDEIADMPIEAQPKLLLALETGAFRAIGASRERSVDVRLIAASNVPLEDALRERRIRADLYHRLNVIRIEIPPLRARVEDVPSLVDETLHRLAKSSGRTVLGISADAMRWLLGQPWPGNVRELMNTLERAVALSEHDVLVLSDFVQADEPALDDRWLADAADESLALDEVERRYIRKVLDQCGGNRARAARVLGVDRTTLWRKLQGAPPTKTD